jgi:hypothetical protein
VVQTSSMAESRLSNRVSLHVSLANCRFKDRPALAIARLTAF